MNNSYSSRRSFWLNLNDSVFRIDQQNLRVRTEQLRTRMTVYPSLVLSQAVLEVLFLWMFWDHAPHQYLLSWLAVFYAMHAVELIEWSLHRDQLNTLQECRNWHAYFTFFSLAAGILWGVAVIAFFPADIAYQSLMICVMIGLVAGAVTINPVHPPALYAYLFGIMAPLTVRVSLENDFVHWILTVMLVVYVVVIVLAGRGLNKTFVLSLEQSFENFSLLQQLQAQKAETEEARSQLEKANLVLLSNEYKLEQMVQERTALLQQRTEENVAIKDTTILALSSLAETRDNETGNHIRRTQHYVRTLAIQLRTHPRFSDFLTDDNIDMLFKIAPLHDIGKVGIPDRILHKPGKLTEEEFEIMKTHTLLGGNAISGAENMSSVRNSPFLRAARQIAIGHHEKWDGSGYPFALRGDNIPIPARLMALADVYDAMSCKRVYKSAMSHDEVTKTIIEGKGRHFDPDVVEAFIAAIGEFKVIATKFSDDDTSLTGLRIGG
ncbi:MAG: HD domain-containing protein [Gammaproteobacteria bacterium]|nr:HD domain-containing protein [Gammaproteobacteria bacterium]MBU1481990.1 HD domain-containing protein [Gammaproteobacteria bacterium]